MLKSKIVIKKEKTFKIGNTLINNTSIKDYRIYNNMFYNLNSNSTLYDLDIKRISKYIYKKELQKRNTILKTIDLKKVFLLNLKKSLNLKKKVYIDFLRNDLNKILNQNALNLFENDLKFNDYNKVLNTLFELKILKNKTYIGFYALNKFYSKKNKDIINKLISLNSDIKQISNMLNNFNDYYKSITNSPLRINSYDLTLLDKGIISQNIREVMYFYLIKIKKSKAFKSNKVLDFKLSIVNIDTQKLLNNIRENLFKNEYKNILNNLPNIDENLREKILNKYI